MFCFIAVIVRVWLHWLTFRLVVQFWYSVVLASLGFWRLVFSLFYISFFPDHKVVGTEKVLEGIFTDMMRSSFDQKSWELEPGMFAQCSLGSVFWLSRKVIFVWYAGDEFSDIIVVHYTIVYDAQDFDNDAPSKNVSDKIQLKKWKIKALVTA